MGAPRHNLAMSFEKLAKKCEIVWEKTKNGWTSRPATKEDKERWKDIASRLRSGEYVPPFSK